MLLFPDGTQFSTAYSTYTYKPATFPETSPRIFLQVSIEGIATEAFVDTGAPYVVCNPQTAEALDLNPNNGERIDKFNIRGSYLDGYLYRMTITILAEAGQSFPIDATVFVPELTPQQVWDRLPSILGLSGFLERIRFAINPSDNKFYFAPV